MDRLVGWMMLVLVILGAFAGWAVFAQNNHWLAVLGGMAFTVAVELSSALAGLAWVASMCWRK